nr:hypothetical protein [Pseudomonas putida]
MKASQAETGMDKDRKQAQAGTHFSEDHGVGRTQQNISIANQQYGDCQAIEQQKALHPARQEKHLPFLPVRGIYLMKDERKHRDKIASLPFKQSLQASEDHPCVKRWR